MTPIQYPIAADPYQPRDFVFKIARSPKEVDGFRRLRRAVFCEEQKVFQGSDEDEHDRNMLPIISLSLIAGMEDEVVGVVRIDEREPGVWWGSRLGVARGFRRIHDLSGSVSVRNRQPEAFGRRSIGAGLIYKAVSTAQALGCESFHALVQSQNAPFFESLHWKSLGEVEVHGLPHVRMQADLEFYPPARHDVAPYKAA